jgi:hypothetical protein
VATLRSWKASKGKSATPDLLRRQQVREVHQPLPRASP